MLKIFTNCLLFFVVTSGFGQTARPDTAFLATSRNYQTSLYNKYIRGQSRLYNGTEYRDYLSHNDEHPYYGPDDWSYGYVVYDDERYDSVALFYDISRDRVITEHLLSGAKIELVTAKLMEFTLNGDHFVHLRPDKTGEIADAFYQVLYDGKSKVYARHTKTLNTRAEGNELVYTFDNKVRYYILKDGVYHSVKSKKSVLKVFEDKKQAVRSELNKSALRFKTDRAKAIAKMAERYDNESRN